MSSSTHAHRGRLSSNNILEVTYSNEKYLLTVLYPDTIQVIILKLSSLRQPKRSFVVIFAHVVWEMYVMIAWTIG